MDTQKYNGWTNYATWMVNLHFDDLDFTDEIDSGVFDHMDTHDIRGHVASLIQDYVESYVEAVHPCTNLFVQNCIDSTINDVDWHDIADHYVEDIQDAVKERDLVAA